MNKNGIKFGFTLAEVLITLVIIGVIAALVIPATINTYVERSTVSKVKKAISILGQAKIQAEAQNGPIQDWNFGTGYTAQTAAQFWSYFKPYIQLAQDCGSGTACYHNDNFYYLNGSSFPGYNTNTAYYKFVLSDGSVMWFRTGGGGGSGKCNVASCGFANGCANFFYDVNGDQQPNILGRDIFYLVMSTDGVFPCVVDDCAKNNQGWGCSGYIVKNSNMKYLH